MLSIDSSRTQSCLVRNPRSTRYHTREVTLQTLVTRGPPPWKAVRLQISSALPGECLACFFPASTTSPLSQTLGSPDDAISLRLAVDDVARRAPDALAPFGRRSARADLHHACATDTGRLMPLRLYHSTRRLKLVICRYPPSYPTTPTHFMSASGLFTLP